MVLGEPCHPAAEPLAILVSFTGRPTVTRALLLLSLVLIVPSAIPRAAADDPKGDGPTLNGTWLPKSAELAGKPFPDEVIKIMKLVMKDGQYTVTVGEATDKGTVKLVPVDKLKGMD